MGISSHVPTFSRGSCGWHITCCGAPTPPPPSLHPPVTHPLSHLFIAAWLNSSAPSDKSTVPTHKLAFLKKGAGQRAAKTIQKTHCRSEGVDNTQLRPPEGADKQHLQRQLGLPGRVCALSRLKRIRVDLLSDELDSVFVLHPALDQGQRHHHRSPVETQDHD